jgi:hypothetical protein
MSGTCQPPRGQGSKSAQACIEGRPRNSIDTVLDRIMPVPPKLKMAC